MLESCFRTALHPTLEQPSGITSLLGESRLFGTQGPSPLPPGAMYIRAAPHCRGGTAVASKIAALVLAQAGGKPGIAGPGRETKDAPEVITRAAKRLRCRHESLREALPTLTQAASLGACLLVMAGGEVVRALYVGALPPLLASLAGSADRKGGLRPYALARLTVMAGLLAWGQSPGPLGSQALQEHIKFLGGTALDGAPWSTSSSGRSYLMAFASLVVEHAPTWFTEIGDQAVEKLSRSVAGAGARSLALRILESSKSSNVAASVELIAGHT